MVTSRTNLRSLHVSPFLALSGTNRSLLTLLKAQQQSRNTFAAVFAEGELSQQLRHLGCEVFAAFRSERSVSSLRTVRWSRFTALIRRAVAMRGITVVHAHSAMAMRYVWPATRLSRAATVAHQRDNYQNDYFHLGLGRADQIIANSAWVRDGLPWNLRHKTTVIHNAVELPASIQWPQGPLVIGMAGRCAPEKGAALFIEACAQLLTRYQFSVELWGLEPCSFEQQLRARTARLPPKLRSRFVLRRFQTDIDDFYRRCHIVVVPSLFTEPFGRVAIEAMAWGRAVVVAGHGGLVETVNHGQTGLHFAPTETASLVEQLETLIQDPELRSQLGKRARQETSQRFTPTCHARQVDAVYELALSRFGQ